MWALSWSNDRSFPLFSHPRDVTVEFMEDLVTNNSAIRFRYTDAVYQAQGMVSMQAGCALATALG